MVDDKIIGYRYLTETDIAMMNVIKLAESSIADLVAEVKDVPAVDQRNIAIARTAFEDAFMRLVRAVARPESPFE